MTTTTNYTLKILKFLQIKIKFICIHMYVKCGLLNKQKGDKEIVRESESGRDKLKNFISIQCLHTYKLQDHNKNVTRIKVVSN